MNIDTFKEYILILGQTLFNFDFKQELINK
jgi:hypothetical protein